MRERFRYLLLNQSDHIFVQLVRYFFVAGVGLVADFAILFVLTEVFGVYYIISAIAGFAVGLTINYLLSMSWVFNNQTIGDRRVEFLAFAGIGVIGLGINTAGLWLLTDLIGIYFLLSKVLVTGFVFAWNFLARHKLLSQGEETVNKE